MTSTQQAAATVAGFREPAVASTGMVIRRPVAEVFDAFIDPAITSRFWFSRGSGRVAPGARLTWFWDMYDVSAEVEVQEVVPNERITLRWGDANAMTDVEWLFRPQTDGATFVSITNTGFVGSVDAICAQVGDSSQGFSFVLAGLKALLEHGIDLRLVPDRMPTHTAHG